MCNLYSISTNQEAIRALFRVVNRYVGNLAPMPGVFPDYPAPVVRNAGAELDEGLDRTTTGRPDLLHHAGRQFGVEGRYSGHETAAGRTGRAGRLKLHPLSEETRAV